MLDEGENPALGVGFIFSAVSIGSLLVPIISIFAFFTYPISVILRAIGWIRLGASVRKYIFTAIAIIIFAPVYYLGFFINEAVSKALSITSSQFLAIMILAWVIYSIFELIGYFWLGREATRIFYGAMISIVGILIVILHIPNIWVSDDILSLASLYIALPFLLTSSIIAAVGSFKLGGVLGETKLVSP